MGGSADDVENWQRHYEVGYGRPDRTKQFKPGQSGNPTGKRKGARSLKADLQAELAEQITLQVGGREIRISKQRAMIKSMVAKAIRGDQRAASKVYELFLQLLGPEPSVQDSATLSAEDQAILTEFLARQIKKDQ